MIPRLLNFKKEHYYNIKSKGKFNTLLNNFDEVFCKKEERKKEKLMAKSYHKTMTCLTFIQLHKMVLKKQ